MVGDTNEDIYTYIIKTVDNEYYCGKTIDIKRRMIEHRKGINGSWFSSKRQKFRVTYMIKEDVEKNIKRFGVEKFVRCQTCLRP